MASSVFEKGSSAHALTATKMNIEQVRFNMVEQQIRTWDVLDTDVLDLLHTLKRENFVPPAQREFALMDIEIPLSSVAASALGEKMWTPKMEARVAQDVGLTGSEHVLEIGTGSGYLTGLLASRAARVTSIEINPDLAKFATTLEAVCVEAIEAGEMTKDLAICISKDAPFLTTEDFLAALDRRLQAKMA